MIMNWRVDRMPLNNDREFQESLGMPSSDLTFHSKREERDPNSTTVTGQCVFFSIQVSTNARTTIIQNMI